MAPRTRFLSRLLGLYLILISLAMAMHRQATLESVTALMNNPPALLITSVMTVAAGLAVVLAHNVWSGGALPVVVTLTGWLMLIKGGLLLFLSPKAAAGVFLTGLHYVQYFSVYTGIALVLGMYLTYGGFRPVER